MCSSFRGARPHAIFGDILVVQRRACVMPLSEQDLFERDAKRDIGAELLAAIRDVKAGNTGMVYRVIVSGDEDAQAANL
jgi:hypothetical protein